MDKIGLVRLEKLNFLSELCSEGILTISNEGNLSIADVKNKASCTISKELVRELAKEDIIVPNASKKAAGQTSGRSLELLVAEFLNATFPKLSHLRPGNWIIKKFTGDGANIAQYEQYAHLAELKQMSEEMPKLLVVIGTNYSIAPDVVVARKPEPDEVINGTDYLVDELCALHSPIRETNNKLPILHASVSCKFTLRTDRAQNARTEALSFIRNRKGRTPHICLVTAEPLPSRLGSIALGTGDVDCVYHIALNELREAIFNLSQADEKGGYTETLNTLDLMIEGKRLKDITDLPFDLVM
ncbi:NgoMIV family type II restriction endonuclease [Sutterella sp.]|uniref:NgoMIV family type II restriction endonuclease n=1 Tax=Sutterella sp. TaxID=1981025 RepID=UPI0026E0D9AB|nr:NgoMIV family type II restriction endonuclease [Sutterella sp.]MDO5532265.1 NgoMIV family type II restriction endonuclease [Sutterella sp.]